VLVVVVGYRLNSLVKIIDDFIDVSLDQAFSRQEELVESLVTFAFD
jgi:hypothetical protein